MSYSPALQASLDQLAASARDTLGVLGVDLDDPAQVNAANAVWLIVANNQPYTPWVLAALAEVLAPVQSRG